MFLELIPDIVFNRDLHPDRQFPINEQVRKLRAGGLADEIILVERDVSGRIKPALFGS